MNGRRVFGIAVGVANHLLFAVTVYFLVGFLAGGEPPVQSGAVAWDWLLALQFAVVHSLLLLPAVRQQITNWIPDPFYGTLFCTATCATLLLAIGAWQSSSVVVWRADGPWRWLIQTAFVLTWPTLLYSISLTGLGYQTGFTPWWYWFRGQRPPRREFRPRSLYCVLRHPIYLSFLGLIWFTPVYTVDRLILNLVWTAYIYYGSVLKDRRLAYYLGETYRDYQTRVPGYPGILWGPLARWPTEHK